RLLGVLTRALGEALGSVGAAARSEALAGADADLPPGSFRVRGRRVPVAHMALLGGLLGPFAQPDDVRPERALGDVDQYALVVRGAFADAVQTGVVASALDHRVMRYLIERRAGRLLEGRDIALDELVLQVQGRGRDHDAVTVQQARHEVAERLAGAGARLHEQMLVVL